VVEKHKIEIAFPSKTPDVAGRLVEDLSKEIRRSVKEDGRPVEPTVVRPDPTAQDFGSTLVLVLGTPCIRKFEMTCGRFINAENMTPRSPRP
jgi:hypothetical protein